MVVTNTAGLLKYELPKKKWEEAKLSLSKGDILDLETLPQRLVIYGYKRGLTVEKQGDFSLRGSILDIYPINEEKTLRIDFFDDEIDSIRYFDVNTQRSTVQTKRCVIYPMYEFFYTDEELQRIKQKIENVMNNNDLSDKAIKRINEDLFNLENRNELDKLSRYLSFINGEPETIIDYMDNQIIVYWDYKRVKESFQDIVRDITDWYDTTGDYASLGFDLIKDMNYIYSGKSLYLDVFGDSKKFNTSLNVRAKETVIYNNNIHMVINDLVKYNRYTTVIVAFKSLKLVKKFIELIEERVEYQLIGINDDIQVKRINLIVQDHTISFELFNINTIVLTEENLYKRKELKKAKYRSVIKDTMKLSTIDELRKGDYVVHYDHGIGRFLGIETMTLGKNTNDYIYIQYRGDDSLYIPVENIKLIQKFVGSESVRPKLNKLGSADWAKTKQRVRKRIKDIADRLIKLYAAREEAKGFAFSEDTELQTDFEAGFEYQETEDQIKAIEDVKKDMESITPMDRLLCGDVGYGKTEVALRAAFIKSDSFIRTPLDIHVG